MHDTREFLSKMGLPAADNHALQPSAKRFPDGAQYRLEIPTTEGPRPLQRLLDEAGRRKVRIHRVSQGSGIMLMTDDEIKEMLTIGRDHGIEVCLFVGPRAPFDIGAMIRTEGGKTIGWQLRGADQLVYAIEDIKRGCELGLRSVLVADIGLIWVLREMKQEGVLPSNLVVKNSVALSSANPAAVRVLQEYGANTINIPTDLPLSHIGALRQAIDIPLDMYVEAPDGLGGAVRYYEAPKLIEVAAPIYLKLGLRNAPDIYPSGTHLEETAIRLAVERVRRAEILMDIIRRYCPEAQTSEVGVRDLGIPEL